MKKLLSSSIIQKQWRAGFGTWAAIMCLLLHQVIELKEQIHHALDL